MALVQGLVVGVPEEKVSRVVAFVIPATRKDVSWAPVFMSMRNRIC